MLNHSFFFSSRRRHTRYWRDWSSDVCSSDLHVNKEIMGVTPYKERIAHGVLSIGFASTTSTLMIEKSGAKAVSLGYDRIRFVGPIFIGDTVTVTYTISEIDEENLRTRADIEVANQRGEVCTVAQHILKFLA